MSAENNEILSTEDQALLQAMADVPSDIPDEDLSNETILDEKTPADTTGRQLLNDDDDDDDLLVESERKLTPTERNRLKRQRRKERSDAEKLELQMRDVQNREIIRNLNERISQIEVVTTSQIDRQTKSLVDHKQAQLQARINQLTEEAKVAGQALDFGRQSQINQELINATVEYRMGEVSRKSEQAYVPPSETPTPAVAQLTPEQRYQREVTSYMEVFVSKPEHTWLKDEFATHANGKTEKGQRAAQICRELMHTMDARSSNFYAEFDRRLKAELPSIYVEQPSSARQSPPTSPPPTAGSQMSRNNTPDSTSSLLSSLSPKERAELKQSMKMMKEANYLNTPAKEVAFIRNYIRQGR